MCVSAGANQRPQQYRGRPDTKEQFQSSRTEKRLAIRNQPNYKLENLNRFYVDFWEIAKRKMGPTGSSKDSKAFCPIVRSIEVVGNKWSLIVVRYLLDRPMRFNEFLRSSSGIDPKTLSRVLKILQTEGIVIREVISTQPFSVQYSLTQKGLELRQTIESLKLWGEKWLQESDPVQDGENKQREAKVVPELVRR